MRIAIAGFQHETNTYVAEPTDLSAFERADSWPGLLTGSEVIDVTRGMNLPIAGFVEAAAESGAELVPILWCAAEPGGRVSDHAFDTICGQILKGVQTARRIDAVYLDLHGAMVTQSHDDGEGHLLDQIRACVRPDIPVVASLDLHANLTPGMVAAADAITVFRTYPHLDMAQAGARAFTALRAIMRDGPPAKAWRQGNYLIPLHAQHTGADPARRLYDALADFDGPDGQFAELIAGFTAADIHDTGPSVLAYARTPAMANAIADDLADRVEQAKPEFTTPLLSAESAVARALSMTGTGPVVIADVQDNPGAGGSSDTTGLLRALVSQKASGALLGLIHDPVLAAQVHRAGEGATLTAPIGGRGPGDTPLEAEMCVVRLSDGACRYTGQMYGGGVATLGASAALRLTESGVVIVVTSIRNQCLDLAHFHHFGLKPEEGPIVCVKSTAHFRADFDPIAQETLLVAAPGQFPCVLEDIPYVKLRPLVRRALRHRPAARPHYTAHKTDQPA